jgi:hypothetical protein
MGSSGTPTRNKLETVHVAQGLLEAHVVKAKLEEAGIPALLVYESIGPVMGLSVDGVGEVRIQVAAEQAEGARALIDRSEEDDC